MSKIKINITTESENLPLELDSKLYDLSYNGIEVMPKGDDFPMPWDAGVYIEDGMFVIDGDLGQQGSHRGFAKVGLPLETVNKYLDIEINPNDEESEAEIKEILEKYGWL